MKTMLYTKEGRTSYQNEYLFASKLFNGEKRMKRYILKNDALHWKIPVILAELYDKKRL
jgi:Uri superfamily endonuclease